MTTRDSFGLVMLCVSIYDQGLITKDQYDQKVTQIMGSL